jgi:hypothetical protein
VAEKRTRGALSVRTVQGEVHAAYAPSEIALPYASYLHCVVAGSDLMLTDRASKRGYAPALFIMSDTNVEEFTFWALQ